MQILVDDFLWKSKEANGLVNKNKKNKKIKK